MPYCTWFCLTNSPLNALYISDVYCLSSLYTLITDPKMFQIPVVREIGSNLKMTGVAQFVFNSLILSCSVISSMQTAVSLNFISQPAATYQLNKGQYLGVIYAMKNICTDNSALKKKTQHFQISFSTMI